MNYDKNVQIIKQLPENNMTRMLRVQYFDIYKEIDTKYQQLNGYPFKYKVYWYLNGIKDFPRCKTCGVSIIKLKLVGSIKNGHLPDCCSLKCSNNNSDVKEKKKQTSIAHYGVENPAQSEKNQKKQKQTCLMRYGVEHPSQIEGMSAKKRLSCLEQYGVESTNQLKETQEKKKLTCLERYGVEYALQAEELIEQRKQTCLKKYGVEYAAGAPAIIRQRKQTCIEKYGGDNPSCSPQVRERRKQTSLRHYGVEYPSQNAQIIEKISNTKRNNNTFNTSKDEQIIYTILKKQYPDTLFQYKSIRYPFNCDFYIPSLDIFIELNFNWPHGKEPYTNTEEQQNIVKLWELRSNEIRPDGRFKKYYKNAIHVWTISDVKKSQWAKEHNLNWLCFYNRKQFYEWFNK